MATYRAQTANTGLARTLVPAAGDLFVMFVVASGNTNDTPTCSDNNPDGLGTYHLVGVLPWNSSGNRASVFVRENLIANTTSTVVTASVGSATATFTALIAISGMTLAGAAAIRQYGEQENQAAGTAQPTVASACLTDNLTIESLFSNDFSTTPPTGWSERVDNGAPPCIHVSTRDSGYTGTGEAFGNPATSTVFAAAFIELDNSAGGGQDVTPTTAIAAASAANPTVTLGGISVTATAAAAAATAADPDVALGGISVTPTTAVATAAAAAPTIAFGGIDVTPTAASAVAAAADPDARIGTMVTPTAVVAAASAADPTVTLGGIAVTPTPAIAVGAGATPTLTFGGITVTPIPAVAVAAAADLSALDHVIPIYGATSTTITASGASATITATSARATITEG